MTQLEIELIGFFRNSFPTYDGYLEFSMESNKCGIRIDGDIDVSIVKRKMDQWMNTDYKEKKSQHEISFMNKCLLEVFHFNDRYLFTFIFFSNSLTFRPI